MDYPIVFIPGLFGSLGDDIIKGTGEFSFGFAEKVYKPFIKILNSMDYEEGKDLFVSYYDWRKSVLESVNKYLYPDIERVKSITGKDKVIVIGHSLGGLLGRAYLNYFSPDNVDKLIMIGTPNFGSVNAYYFWSGGKLPYDKVEDNILYNGIKAGFILYYTLYPNKDYIDGLRDIFPVTRDLLPSYGYGNYLYQEEKNRRIEVPIDRMSISNEFLNNINNTIYGNNVYIISGKGYYTNKGFIVEKRDKKRSKWADGKPIRSYKTNYGDGTVTTFSTLGNFSKNHIVIEGNHTDILYKSKDYLSRILERPIIEDVVIEDIEKIQVILAKDSEDVEVITSDGSRLSHRDLDRVDNRIKSIDLGNNDLWIMATGDKNLDININTIKGKKSKSKIYKDSISKS